MKATQRLATTAVLLTVLGGLADTPAHAASDDLVLDGDPAIVGLGGEPVVFTVEIASSGPDGRLNMDLAAGTSDDLHISDEFTDSWLFEYEASPGQWQPIDTDTSETAGTDIAVSDGTLTFRIGQPDPSPGSGGAAPAAAAAEAAMSSCLSEVTDGVTLTATLFSGDVQLDREVRRIRVGELTSRYGGPGGFGEEDPESGPIPVRIVAGVEPRPFTFTVCHSTDSGYVGLTTVPFVEGDDGGRITPAEVRLERKDPTSGEWVPVELAPDGPARMVGPESAAFDLGTAEERLATFDFRIAFAPETAPKRVWIGMDVRLAAERSHQHPAEILVLAAERPREPQQPELPDTGGAQTAVLMGIGLLCAGAVAIAIWPRAR